MRLALAILMLLGTTAVAAPTITFTKGPEDKYRCSRYAPGSRGTLEVKAPPGKPMVFSFAAVASDRSKVSYRAEGLPPGATVDAKGVFSWQIPKDAKGAWTVTLVAEAGGAKATQAFALAIAEPDLVAAWRAGMGSFSPDCSAWLEGYTFEDLDGDGKTELVFTLGDTSDDSANQGSDRTFVRKRTATGFDTVERQIPNGHRTVYKLPDGKPAVVIEDSCCCMAQVSVVRITATGVDDLGSGSGTDCAGYTPIDLETNAKGQLVRIITRFGDADGTSSTTLRWQNGKFER